MSARFRVRSLMLAVLGTGALLASIEFARRAREPRPPLPWPWINTVDFHVYSPEVWVNGEDLRRGMSPPHTKFVYADGRVEDAPGAYVPPHFFKNPPPENPQVKWGETILR